MKDELTREGVAGLLREAVRAVEEAGVPDDLRAAAFEHAFNAMLGADAGCGGQPHVAEPDASAGPSGEPSLQTMAKRLGLDPEMVRDVYYVDGDELGLSLAPSRFDPRKAAATKQIALLVAAGRQAGGWEEWTPVRIIRETVRDYGRFDQANFATTIKNIGHAFNLRGRAQQVEVRVTRPGLEQAAQLIRELTEA